MSQALATLRRIIPTNPPNEIYRNVLLRPGSIEANNGEIRCRIASDYDGSDLCVSARQLHDITQATTSDSLTIEAVSGRANIQAQRGVWKMPTADGELWQHATNQRNHSICNMPADQLASIIQTTIDAADKLAVSNLNAICFDLNDGKLNVVATDGRRLHCSEVDIEQATDDCEVLIPAQAASIVAALANKAGSEFSVQIDRNDSEVVFQIGDPATTIWVRQANGRFPKWRGVVPEKKPNTTIVNAKKLQQAVKQAAICSAEDTKSVAIKWGSTTTISCKSSEYGTSRVDVEPIRCNHDAETKVNPAFCVDWLKHVDGMEPVDVDIAKNGALVFRNETSTAVIMPMEQAA